MAQDKIMVRCDMCGNQFQMGPHVYDGKYIKRYDLSVCKLCYDGNWDGWGPNHEDRLIQHLKEKRISLPPRNEKGWIPRD